MSFLEVRNKEEKGMERDGAARSMVMQSHDGDGERGRDGGCIRRGLFSVRGSRRGGQRMFNDIGKAVLLSPLLPCY